MADPAGVQAHEHLARARGRELQLGDLERRPGVLEDGRANLQGAPPGCGGLPAAGSPGKTSTPRSGGAVCCSSRSASTE